MRPAVVAPAIAFTLVLGSALSSCASNTSPITPESLIGDTLNRIDERVGVDMPLIIQDVSVVLDETPTYNGDSAQDDQWTVVAACSSDEHIVASSDLEVAVLPIDSVTGDIEEAIEARRYSDVVDCTGRPYHG